MQARTVLVRVTAVSLLAMFVTVMPPLIAPPHGARTLATGGLPTVTEVQGLITEASLLASDPGIQKAYVSGVLDALLAVIAEGEAFAAAGLDPRNAYGIVYEAVAGLPDELSLETLRETILKYVTASPDSDQAAALAIWRTLAVSHCCWDQ